jgi:hypothetical protein
MGRTRKNYRLSDGTVAVIRAIAEACEGLTETRVIENAVDLYGKKVLGRAMADLVAPRARPGRRHRSGA